MAAAWRVSAQDQPKRVRVGVIGCHGVSGQHSPRLLKSPFVELVSTCGVIPWCATSGAEEFEVPHYLEGRRWGESQRC